VVGGENQDALARITTNPGLKSIRFVRDGRYGFAVNGKDDHVYAFDASTNRVLHAIAVGKNPDKISFTEGYAYVRSLSSDQVSLIRLDAVNKIGEVPVIEFSGGQVAPDKAPGASTADVIVSAPEGNSVLVANPADKIIYYYAEGMAAPMGSFQNYRREPRAVMVIDRSLREITSGVYSTTTKLPKSGIYDVAFLLDSPRITHCFEAEAKPNPDVRHEKPVPLRVEYLNKEKQVRVGENYKLRFKLFDTATSRPKSDLNDVRVLTFLASATWQKRDFARPVGDGVYELDIKVPQTGLYLVFVESRSQGVDFRQLPHLMLHTHTATATNTQ
jgi:YVTN family beta-propeller protein